LGPRGGRLEGRARLEALPLHGLVAGEIEIAHELLRDGGPALHDAAGTHVGDKRAEDPDRVDAAMLIEAPVLDRDGRLRHPWTDRVALHGGPVLDGREDADEAAVGAVDQRAVRLAHRLQRAQVAARTEVDGAARSREREQGEWDRNGEGDDNAAAAPESPPRLRLPLCAHVQTPSARRRWCARRR